MTADQLALARLRPATTDDIERAWTILQDGKAQMLREGKRQWTAVYPARESVEADVARGVGYVLTVEDAVVAYGAVVFTGEPAYDHLAGEWLTYGDYVVVHRLAVAEEAKRCGVAKEFMRQVFALALQRGVKSCKIDTNYDNFYMHKMLRSLGFRYCGTVVYPQGSRMCYERTFDPDNEAPDDKLIALEHYLIGKSFANIGDNRQAMACYYKAVELDPESPATVAIEHHNEVMNFYHKDLYNP